MEQDQARLRVVIAAIIALQIQEVLDIVLFWLSLKKHVVFTAYFLSNATITSAISD